MIYQVEWVVGGLIAVVKGLLLYVWFSHDKKLSEVSTEQVELGKVLMSNYYSKREVEQYVGKELSSVQQSIDRLSDVIVPLTLELRKLNDKVLVLETKEQINGRIG